MNIKRNPLKILTAFITAVITTILGSNSTKVLSVETKAFSEQTIEERLANVREKLKQREEQINSPLSSQDNLEAKEDKTLLSWYDWSDWSNWRNWRDWGDW